MIAVCLKWAALHADVEPLTGGVRVPDQAYGLSAADMAALELALMIAHAQHVPVRAVTVGGPKADAALRMALEVGATAVLRIAGPVGATSATVAAALAVELADATLVMCGDYSADRGSASVPAYLAAALGWGSALGLVEVRIGSNPSELEVMRRLDGGRRELLAIGPRTVLSVEGAAAKLRRADLTSTRRAKTASIPVTAGQRFEVEHHHAIPMRPRPHVVAAPMGAVALDRVRQLLTAAATAGKVAPIALDPATAADRIVEALRGWGYLTDTTDRPGD